MESGQTKGSSDHEVISVDLSLDHMEETPEKNRTLGLSHISDASEH